MDVSIIIVNYKTSILTIQCIESIYKYTTGINYEIIVVDNYSQDNSKHIITNKFNPINFISLEENIGYGRANNIGIKNAKGTYLLILNNDTIFTENVAEKLFLHLEEDNEISAAGVQLYYEDGSKQLSGSKFVLLGLNILLTFPYIAPTVKYLSNQLNIKKPHPTQSKGIEIVDWISGAFMFVRKKAIEKVGAFDEDFFLFSEEAEWCYRLQKEGKIAIFPELSLIHIGGKTMQHTITNESENYYPYWDKKGLQLMVSNLLKIRKQYGIVATFLHLLLYFFAAFVDVFLSSSLFIIQFTERNKYKPKRALQFLLNCFKILKYIIPILFKVKKLYKVF